MNYFAQIVNYEFSETDDFVDITTRLSYLNDYNGNGFRLVGSEDNEDTLESVKTLINTPLVAYYNSNIDDFEGHKVIKTKDGVNFGTHAIGTHTDAWIELDKVKPVFSDEEVELPCIFGKSRIWASRFPRFYQVLKKRLEKDEMFTSWELKTLTLSNDENVTNDNIPNPRSSDKWMFLGNCLLGSSPPAYGKNSKVLEMSSVDDFDLELSEALSQDVLLNNKNNKGGQKLSKKKIEKSALSMRELEHKVWKAINTKGWDSNPYYSIVDIHIDDQKAICRDWEESEEDLWLFEYTIDEEGSLTITNKEKTNLSKVVSEKANINIDLKLDDTAKLLSEKEVKIKDLVNQLSELNEKVKEYEADIAEAGKSITTLTKEKEDLETQISELNKYKEQVEKMEEAENERILSEKKEELKSLALEDELIESSELEEDETLKQIFSELTLENFEASQEKIEVIKGRRAIEKFKQSKQVEESELETSESKEGKANPKRNLNDSDEMLVSATDAMKAFLSKK